jgi:subtilisin family serine protease
MLDGARVVRPERFIVYWSLVALSACDPDRGPPSAPSMADHDPAAATQSRPFYYYQGARVYLEEDPSRITVFAAGDDPPQEVARALSRQQVSGQTEKLRAAAGHWVVKLKGANSAAARAAVADLKREKGYRFASTAFKTEGGSDVLLVNEVIVRFKDGVTREDIVDLGDSLGMSIVREPRPDSGFFEYRLAYPTDVDAEPLAIAALLDRHPLVQWADPNAISDRKPTAVPTDPYYPVQWHMTNTTTRNGIRVNINVVPAWDRTLGGGVPSQGGLRVGVIGEGVQANHPDFGSKVQAGYDGVLGNTGLGCSDCATSPFGDDNHETSAAGIIVAQHSNGRGVAGIAPGALIVPARIFRNGNLEVASDAEIANSINYVWQLGGASVISNSWSGGRQSNAITNAINQAYLLGRGGKGTLVVFSAGNTSIRSAGIIGSVNYPATLGSVLAVGAINRSGEVTDYSPEGSQLDIVAPSGHFTGHCAGEIVTTDLSGSRGCNAGPQGNVDYTTTFSGTSAAAPQVAGAAALLFSIEPTLTVATAMNRILGTADPWGPATRFGAGKLNIGRLIPPPPPPFTVTANAPGTVTAKGTYPLTGSANYPASIWRWERSNNGGSTWSLWATTQNSSFVAFAGEDFTIRWRLTATRTSDGVTDNHVVSTLVCTVTGGQCDGPLLAGAADGSE